MVALLGRGTLGLAVAGLPYDGLRPSGTLVSMNEGLSTCPT